MKKNGLVSKREARTLLAVAVESYGSQKAFATKFAIDPAVLSNMLRGRRDLNDRALVILGLRRIETEVQYERVEVKR